MHTIHVRWHNFAAMELAKVNPTWSDEKVFQTTRQLVSAINQQITYKEMLPIIMGPYGMEMFDLRVKNAGEGYTDNYNDYCSPDITNEFATACFRFFHSTIPNELQAVKIAKGKVQREMKPLLKLFMNPADLYFDDYTSHYLMGLSDQEMLCVDSDFSNVIQDELFKLDSVGNPGIDLAASNMQRARDHGLGSYTDYRKMCGLSVPKKMNDLKPIMGEENMKNAKKVYNYVEDMDLFAGGMAEKHEPLAMVGPTFQCILGEQFERIKNCDRFWYENGGQPHSYTLPQLDSIRQFSLAKMMCETRQDHGKDIMMKQHPMLMNSEWKKCDDMPGIDYSLWKEE